MQCGMFRREARDAGASMVMMDMRYMWSEMDSPWEIIRRRHPSRGVVLRRSMMCRKGSGVVVEGDEEGGLGMAARAVGREG